MRKTLSLRNYIKRRNGVPLGAKGSLSNMFTHALGAGNFAQFWHYWNPIWGYYLAKVFRQLKRQLKLPDKLALILTFTISGALHDIAIMLISQQVSYKLTLWFCLMGVLVVLSQALSINYQQHMWLVRATINSSYLVCSFVTVNYLLSI